MSYTHGVIHTDGSTASGTLEEWIPCDVGVEFEYAQDGLALATPPGVYRASSAPVTASNETVQCWVIGDVYGAETSDGYRSGGYEPRSSDVDPAQYCLSRYERDGLEFVDGLNGNFALILYDVRRDRVAICTDRLGTVPIYWTQTDSDTIVFSTNVQFLPFHPAVETAFDPGYLHEYLAFRRTFGVKTPLEGIETLRPGTTTTISLTDGERSQDSYWRPRYRPRDRPFDWFVDTFADRFQTVVDEWTRDDSEYGILLSGGSDSRLVLAALDDATAFHMNDWMNREARVAERVALAAGAEFELLERGPDYRIDALERNRWADSFTGWFSQPYTSGFRSELTAEVDGFMSGLYADTLFDGFPIPSPTTSLGPLGKATLPVERSIESVDDYVDYLLESAHDGLEMPTDLRTVLEENVYRDGDRIVHHGVTYESLDELVYYGDCYPLSNDDDMRFHTDLRRTLPYRSPFLDNRLVDLSLSLPTGYRLRRNLIDRAVERLDPDLAAIPHAGTSVAVSRSFPVAYAGEHLTEFRDKFSPFRSTPAPYLTHGPWLDDGELLRSFGFASDVLESKAGLADALPGPDADDLCDIYRDHRRGHDYVGELYTALTVLSMPVTAQVLDDHVDGRPDETDGVDGRANEIGGAERCPEPTVIDLD